ncbi:MAG: IscS subfamily cysteine desulfurase [Gammaproteobacteria bacterium CG_4_10_14_0_8_um_filter_38_16]|nr:MAG: IscS subfamily cysteine desulfurase [Gammaproteobacteria bacterium CG_4_10_14_0_8_um_filter_38_16]PJA03123.1 MAG: IscS subfamily cysteine desulfurase [Gammaproteobacteria bacterium CG_4_10_14_0_2_um_filter_38_22]PJB09933.1 MAG: IscS subfamily cysteine desulfurase [Gammaproteobacteria bacterium CG_4_9_14_3_um_filter_38_9]
MIYLDYMSTTPVDPRVVDVMKQSLENDFGNAASQHALGFVAHEKIENARKQVASFINAEPNEIIFTSGATESINLALKGVALFYQRQGKHIITLSTEHKAVLDTCRYLASIGFEVTYLNPEKNGLLDIAKLNEAIRPDTILASVMHVNNETGVIQDIAAIGKLLREKGVWFHVDAAQSVGKMKLDLKNLPIDLLSISSHKIYGPKGVGALYVRRKPRVQLIAQLHGGEQENQLRSGTLPTHQIVGLGEACLIAKNNLTQDVARIKKLRDQLEKNIFQIPGANLNGDKKNRVCGCLNFSFDHIDTGLFLKKILKDLAISQGSACNAVDPEPSHVLIAMGLSRDQANRSFRVSVGRFTTEKEIETASKQIIAAAQLI